MFLERHLQRLIENYVPLQTDMFDIKEILPTIEPFLKRLEVRQLLPPTVYMVTKLQLSEFYQILCVNLKSSSVGVVN